MKKRKVLYKSIITTVLTITGIFLLHTEMKGNSLIKIVHAEQAEQTERYAKIKSLNFKHSYLSIRAGEKVELEFSVKPKRKVNYIFESTEPDLLTVSQKGVVKARKNAVGKKVKVMVKAKDGSGIRDRIWIYILPAINPNRKMVALTFDDGPKAPVTRRICRTLKEYGGVATFFTIGSSLTNKENKSAMRQAFRQGNEIANHTLNHKQLTKLSADEIQQQVQKNDALIRKITGVQAGLLRPPYGAVSPFVEKQVGKPMILWSIDTRDWSHLDSSRTYREVMSKVHDGSIVLMHDCYEQTADAAARIIPALQKKGYQFVTVSELYRYKGKELEKGKIYRGF